jgi:hypothetical protein
MRSLCALTGCLLLIVMTGCNAGPFGGSSTLYDTQGDQPLGADGRQVKMRGSASWGFVKIHTQMEWVSGDTRRDPFEVAREIERFLARPGTPFIKDPYPDTRTIVCIDPIVVIITQGESKVTSRTLNGLIEPGGTAAWFKWGSAKVYLPHAYQYGTKINADGDIQWYSPTLNISPTPLVPSGKEATINISSEGRSRSLSLSRQGNWWRVKEGDPG